MEDCHARWRRGGTSYYIRGTDSVGDVRAGEEDAVHVEKVRDWLRELGPGLRCRW